MGGGILFFIIVITLVFSKEDEISPKNLYELDKKKSDINSMESVSLAFQNILHEMRTPLTLIMSPLEDEIHKEKNKNLEIAFKNSKRLYHLTNQLLEVHKAST